MKETIEIDGKEYTNMSTADAIAAGIQVIYQDFQFSQFNSNGESGF